MKFTKTIEIFFFYFFCLLPIFSKDIKYTIGNTTQYFETRFTKQSDKVRNNLFTSIQYKNTKTFLEKRGNRYLGSFLYKNDYLYFSTGHRYKPVNGFYILKEANYYSAFQNPKHGVIPQPIHRSLWMGSYIYKWNAGFFFGKDISEKRQGFYLTSPKQRFNITYSPESKIGFLNINVRNSKIKKISDNVYFSQHTQIMGTKEKNFGYTNLKIYNPKKGLEFYASAFKEDDGNLYNTNPDKISGEGQAKTNYVKLSRYHYDRIEFFQNRMENRIEKVYSGNMSLFYGNWGAICLGGRYYHNTNIKDKSQTFSTKGMSLAYEYRLLSTQFLLRYEKRVNHGEVGELKFTLRPIQNWKMEISSIFQSEKNKFRSPFEQWGLKELKNIVFTDRIGILKMKLSSRYLIFNISGSRKRNGKGDLYFANIQFKMDF